MRPAARGARPSPIALVALGMFASPAAAAWSASSGPLPPSRRGEASLARGAALALSVLLALTLGLAPLRGIVASTIWIGFCLAASAALAAWARTAPGALRRSPPPRETGARDAFRAVAAAAFLAPPLVLLTHLAAAASLGSLLVRVDPASADPEAAFQAIAWGIVWGVPSGSVFAVLSLRRGRLRTASDLGRAALAFVAVLFLLEILVAGSVHALRTLTFGAELAPEAGAAQGALLEMIFFAAAVPISLGLAWGDGSAGRRLLRSAGLVLAGLLNLGLALGFLPRVEFVAARQMEKAGRIGAALRLYERALSARSTPLVESYLQHRIGLLNHKLGQEDRALASFRLVQATRNANPELARQSAFYLDRLVRERPGRRVVLRGIEVKTELRDAYCAPNTLALVLNYWGRGLSPGRIGEEVALIGGGTALSGIRFLCERRGLDHLVVPFAGVDDLHWLVDHGIPAMAYLPGHVLAVFGYDTRLDTLITYDTATWDIWVDEPLPDFLETWGKTSFLLGVALPRGGDVPAGVEQARRRYLGRSSEAAWRYQTALESAAGEERAAHLRAALLADPAFYPAAFGLLEVSPSDRIWVDRHADPVRLIAAARSMLFRDRAPTGEVAQGLARWLLAHRDWRGLLDLADRLERRNDLDSVRLAAGIAAARLGRWERAAFLLRDADTKEDARAAQALAEAQRALGQRSAAAVTAASILEEQRDDSLEDALALLEPAAGGQGAGRLADALHEYLNERPYDVPRQLRMAELSLTALREGGAGERRPRLHRARLAVLTALALSERVDERARAARLLARVDAAEAELETRDGM
jgi:tetratricopeptide (TPR) repeat protein